MEETTYTLSIHESADTSNVNYLLKGCDGYYYPDWAPRAIESFEHAFGPGNVTCYDPNRGYEDPEWYWKSSDGCVWGVGWRYGKPRLRGKGNVTTKKAEDFLGFLYNSLENRMDRELNNLTNDLESVVVQLILDEAQDAEFDLSDTRIRKTVVNALTKAAKTFDCSDEEWKEMT